MVFVEYWNLLVDPINRGKGGHPFIYPERVMEVVVRVLQVQCKFFEIPANMFDSRMDMFELFSDKAGLLVHSSATTL